MIKFYKCREDIIVRNIEDPGDNYWAVAQIKPVESKYPEYVAYRSNIKLDQYNLLPTRGLCYINVASGSYGLLIRHDLTLRVPPKESINGLISFNLNEKLEIDQNEYNKLPD